MISVCLASHNGLAFLEKQILSILEQLDPQDELLIGDDASTDGTLEYLQSLQDPRIQVMAGRFGGPIANFDFLLSKAQGQWIVFSDQDDQWLPGRIECLREVPDHIDVVLCDAIVVDSQGNLLAPSLLEAHGMRRGIMANLYHNCYTGCCMALRRRFLRHCHPFPKDIGMHDWWIGLRAEQLHCAQWIQAPLVRHLRHGTNASSGFGQSRLNLTKQLSMRLRLAGLLMRCAMFPKRPLPSICG
jgi:glycosyltransferase involved in cell wall biosynthesis